MEVVSPVRTVRAWAGLRLVAERSYRAVRGRIHTLIVTGIDGSTTPSATGASSVAPADGAGRPPRRDGVSPQNLF